MPPASYPRATLTAGAAVAVGGLGFLLPAHGGVGHADRGARPALELPGPRLTPERKIQGTADRWAVLFAASYPTYCDHMTERACARDWPPALRRSFRGTRVEAVAIEGDRAGARFSNGRTIGLVHVDGFRVGGVWWIEAVTRAPGRARYRHVTGVGRRAGRDASGHHTPRARRLRRLLPTS